MKELKAFRKYLAENKSPHTIVKRTPLDTVDENIVLDNEFTFADIFNSADTGDATLEDEEEIIAPAMEYLQVKSAKDMVLVASSNDGKWYRPGDFRMGGPGKRINLPDMNLYDGVGESNDVRMGYTTIGELKTRPVVSFSKDDENFIYAKKIN